MDSSPAYTFTEFYGAKAASKAQKCLTLPALRDAVLQTSRREKAALPWLKFATFGETRTDKNSYRHDANVIEVTGLEADYDGEVVHVSEAVEKLTKAGVLAFVYTSPSHAVDKPRWRVVCPFSQPYPPEKRAAFLGRLNGLLGGILAGESWTLSQSYFYGSVGKNPAHTAEIVEGEHIDRLDGLDEIWLGKPNTGAAKVNVSGEKQSGPVDQVAVLQEIEDGKSYHTAMMRLLGVWALNDSVPMVEAKRRILDAMETTFPLDRDKRWNERRVDLDRCIQYVYGKQDTKPEAAKAAAEAERKAENSRKQWAVLTPSQCEAGNPRPYVIKGLIGSGDHAQFMGNPGSGKSAVAPLAGYCIALGIPFFGRRVRQGRVLYIAPEDGHGMKLRVRALRKRLGDAPDFLLVPESLDLLNGDSSDLSRACSLIKQYNPVAVFLDTLSKGFPGLRENDTDDMGRAVQVARQLTAEECHPAIITVHHIAKDGGTTPRGSGVLNGDLDATFLVEGSGAALRTVTMGKNRNGPSDASFAFNIETEDFGQDDDGDLITAPIAAPVEDANPARKTNAEAKLNDKQRLMLRELRDLLDRHGELVQPGSNYPSVRAVSRNLLRSRLVERAWFAENLLRTSADGKTEMDRTAYTPENHALTALKAKGLASFNREYVWLL